MRFFFISYDILPYIEKFENSKLIGGAEKQQFLIIHELIRRGHDIFICTNDEQKSHGHPYQLWRIPQEKKLLKYWDLFKQLVSLNPDVIYLRSPSNLGAIAGIYSILFGKNLLYFAAHDTDFNPKINLQGYHPLLYWILLKCAHKIFCQNDIQIKLLKENYGRHGKIFGNIIEIEEGKKQIDHQERSYYLWVGRIEPFKRIELIIEIAKNRNDQRFVVIAPENIQSAYSRMIIASMVATPNIDYIEFVKPDDIGRYYQKAKALINTSEYEGFPNTYLEAFNNGSPVFSLGVDPSGVIQKSNGKLGHVFDSTKELSEEIEQKLGKVDRNYMHSYLQRNHSIKNNVDVFFETIMN